MNGKFRPPYRGSDRNHSVMHARSARDHHITAPRFGSGGHDVLARFHAAIDNHLVANGLGVFDHHDGIRTVWHGSSRHDLHTVPRDNRHHAVLHGGTRFN